MGQSSAFIHILPLPVNALVLDQYRYMWSVHQVQVSESVPGRKNWYQYICNDLKHIAPTAVSQCKNRSLVPVNDESWALSTVASNVTSGGSDLWFINKRLQRHLVQRFPHINVSVAATHWFSILGAASRSFREPWRTHNNTPLQEWVLVAISFFVGEVWESHTYSWEAVNWRRYVIGQQRRWPTGQRRRWLTGQWRLWLALVTLAWCLTFVWLNARRQIPTTQSKVM